MKVLVSLGRRFHIPLMSFGLYPSLTFLFLNSVFGLLTFGRIELNLDIFLVFWALLLSCYLFQRSLMICDILAECHLLCSMESFR